VWGSQGPYKDCRATDDCDDDDDDDDSKQVEQKTIKLPTVLLWGNLRSAYICYEALLREILS
jgi:hypothetical protein